MLGQKQIDNKITPRELRIIGQLRNLKRVFPRFEVSLVVAKNHLFISSIENKYSDDIWDGDNSEGDFSDPFDDGSNEEELKQKPKVKRPSYMG